MAGLQALLVDHQKVVLSAVLEKVVG
jgi:hypothetical protein